MADDKQGEEPGRTQGSSKPSHIAYHVREGQEGKAYFNRIGAAFPHKDGQGHDIQLDAVPVDGRISLRTLKDRMEAQRNGVTQSSDRDTGRGD